MEDSMAVLQNEALEKVKLIARLERENEELANTATYYKKKYENICDMLDEVEKQMKDMEQKLTVASPRSKDNGRIRRVLRLLKR